MRKSKTVPRNLHGKDKMLRILEMNNIHPMAVQHWRESSDGNMMFQMRADGIVYEYSGRYGNFINKCGEQLMFEGFNE